MAKFMPTFAIAIAVSVLYWTLTNAYAGSQVEWKQFNMKGLCGERAAIEAQVRKDVKEDFFIDGGGVSGLGQLWEVWRTASGKWALVLTAPGITKGSCVIAGHDEPDNWQARLTTKTKEGSL